MSSQFQYHALSTEALLGSGVNMITHLPLVPSLRMLHSLIRVRGMRSNNYTVTLPCTQYFLEFKGGIAIFMTEYRCLTLHRAEKRNKHLGLH